MPILPPGVVVGEYCLALGAGSSGDKKLFKAMLISVRNSSTTPLLVKYLGDGATGKVNPLDMPAVLKSFLTVREVEAWVPPEERAAPADAPDGAGATEPDGGGGGEGRGRAGLRALPAKQEVPLLTEVGGRPHARCTAHTVHLPSVRRGLLCAVCVRQVGGLSLHLDPRRTVEGYSGTGYKGIHDDYWPTGYKKDRPYTCSYDGKYQGRFATPIQAAVQYARLDLGLPLLDFDELLGVGSSS